MYALAGSQMAAGRKATCCNAVWLDAVFIAAASDNANSTRKITHWLILKRDRSKQICRVGENKSLITLMVEIKSDNACLCW